MPNASVDIGGDASGALAAVGAAQAAIDSLSGKTVNVDVNVRQNGGGGGGLGGLAEDLNKVAKAGQRANRATKGMAENMERAGKAGGAGMAGGFERAGRGAERAGRAARSMGEEMERAGGHAATLAAHAERINRAVGAIGAGSGMAALGAGAAVAGRGMRELESSTGRAGQSMRAIGSSASGMRAIGSGASSAGREMKSLESGTNRVGQSMKAIESGAARAGKSMKQAMADAHPDRGGTTEGFMAAQARYSAAAKSGSGSPIATPFNNRAVGSGSKASSSGGSSAGFSWAGVDPSSMGNTGGFSARPEGMNSRAHQKEQERAAAGPQAERPFSSGGAAEQLAARKAASGVDEVGKASEKAGGSAKSMMSALTQGGSPHHIERMIRPLQEAGFQLAMVGGMMAGAAKSADGLMNATTGMGLNFKGMSAGIQQAEQSAARSHNLGLNGMDQELRQSARAMTNELAPAMKAGVSATKAFEQAKMAGQASTGGALESFANQMTKSSPALGGIMGSLGKAALNAGQDVVAGFSQTGPAFASMADSIAKNGPQIAQFSKDVGNVIAGTVSTAASAIGGAEDMGNAINNTMDKALGTKRDPSSGRVASDAPSGVGDTIKANLDKMLGARRDPSSGGVSSLGNWGDYNMSGPKPGSPAAAGAPGRNTAGAPVKPGAFDPNKPFSGTLPDGTVGTGDGGSAKSGSAGGGAYHRSPDAAWADGMTGAQVLTAERARVGLGPVGSQSYSGHGAPPAGLGKPLPGAAPAFPTAPPGTFSSEPGDLAHQPNASSGNPQRSAGFGSGARPMSSAAAGGLGVGALAPLNDMMGAAQSQIAGGGAATGAATVQHIQKAVQTAAPAAAAGGASLGGAMNLGMAAGSNSTQSVVDTVTIKHSKHVIEVAAGALGVHSPSKEFDYLGRMTWAGFGQGSERASAGAFGSMSDSMGGVLSGAQDMASKFSPDYDGNSSPNLTVSVPKPNQAMQYDSPLANKNIQRHNEIAGQLATGRENDQRRAIGGMTHDERAAGMAQGRADLHERALANLHISGHPKQSGDVNPFAAQQNAQRGTSLWDTISKQGPIGDLRQSFATHGENMTKGVVVGLNRGTASAQAGVTKFAQGMQTAHRKAHGISSPATVWAGDGMNMAAGVPVGFSAGVPAATSQITASATQMSNAIAGPLNNQGLMLGYSYAMNVVTGATQVLKNANFQASSNAQIANAQAAAAVGQIGLLGTGSGSSVYKTPSVAMDGIGAMAQQIASLSQAIQSQPIHVHVDLDGQFVDHKIVNAQDRFVSQMLDAHFGTNG